MPNVLRAKCIVVGDAAVGKSALTQVFHSDGVHFPKTYTMSVGVELCTKTINVPDTHDRVEFFIYDSAGKDIFTEQVMQHWDHPSMVMVVYDVTNEASFSNCSKWLERVQSQKPNFTFPGVLVANKVDLEQRRIISLKEGKKFAEDRGLEYFECSTKEMSNVDHPFVWLAKAYHAMYMERAEHFKMIG